MDYFKEIGEKLSARCGEGELGENFPELAAEVLAEIPVPADIGIEFMANWALGAETGENKTCAPCPRHGAECMQDRIIAKVR